MKKQQMFPEVRKDLARDDIVRALVVQPQLALAALNREVTTSFGENPENLYFFEDVIQQCAKLCMMTPNMRQRYAAILSAMEQIPSAQDHADALVALGTLADIPWKACKNMDAWRNLPSPVKIRINGIRDHYASTHRYMMNFLIYAFQQFTGDVFAYGQLVSYFSNYHGFASTRYPIGGIMNPVLEEYNYHMLENSPNISVYRETITVLRDYGPSMKYWKELPLTAFLSFYTKLRNRVLRDIDRKYVIKVVESGIAKQIFKTECPEVAVSRKFQDYDGLLASVPKITENRFLAEQKTNQAGNLSYTDMQAVRNEMGSYFGHLRELEGLISASVSAETAVASSRS